METETNRTDKFSNDLFRPAVKDVGVHVLSRPSLSFWKDAWRRLKKNKQALASLYIIGFLLAFTLIGPFLWTVDPSSVDVTRDSEPPKWNQIAVVAPEQEFFTAKVLEDFPATPETEVEPEELTSPQELKLINDPTTLSIRMEWMPVVGAEGYQVYRSYSAPSSSNELGVPLSSIEGGNVVSFEDSFDLKDETYFYSVVATNYQGESPNYTTLEVTPLRSVSLDYAQGIDPNAVAGSKISLPFRPFGTDYLGRDMLARLMSGARISLFIGIVAPLLYTLIGIILGGISGFYGGKVDQFIMRFSDLVIALPFLLFMILFRVAFGGGPGESGITPLLVAMVVLAWPGSCRLVRGQILQLRESEFVHASKLMGASAFHVIMKHMIPNTMGVILVSLTFAIPSAIFTEAFLSFIGMGVAPPTASWGSMANEGVQRFLTVPHEFLIPALFISVAVLAFNLLGDGLRDALDPKLRAND